MLCHCEPVRTLVWQSPKSREPLAYTHMIGGFFMELVNCEGTFYIEKPLFMLFKPTKEVWSVIVCRNLEPAGTHFIAYTIDIRLTKR